MVYRRSRDLYLMVVNASNADKDWAWLNAVNNGEVLHRPRSGPTCECCGPATLRDLKDPASGADMRVDLALQGPAALPILQSLTDDPRLKDRLARVPKTGLIECTLAGFDLVIARTGYTGEEIGYEIFVHPDQAVACGRRCWRPGSPSACSPAAWPPATRRAPRPACRSTATSWPGHYGISPVGAGFGSYVKLHKPYFIGRPAHIEREKARTMEIARFRMNDRGVRMPKTRRPGRQPQGPRHRLGDQRRGRRRRADPGPGLHRGPLPPPRRRDWPLSPARPSRSWRRRTRPTWPPATRSSSPTPRRSCRAFPTRLSAPIGAGRRRDRQPRSQPWVNRQGEKMSQHVFISYSSHDKATADAVCAYLEARKIRCWIAPRDVPPASIYAEALIDAIDECGVFVLIFSDGSNKSGHVISEVEEAADKNIPILPFRIQDVACSKAMGFYIKKRHWLDAFVPPLEQHLSALAERLETLLKLSRAAPPAEVAPQGAVDMERTTAAAQALAAAAAEADQQKRREADQQALREARRAAAGRREGRTGARRAAPPASQGRGRSSPGGWPPGGCPACGRGVAGDRARADRPKKSWRSSTRLEELASLRRTASGLVIADAGEPVRPAGDARAANAYLVGEGGDGVVPRAGRRVLHGQRAQRPVLPGQRKAAAPGPPRRVLHRAVPGHPGPVCALCPGEGSPRAVL